MARLPSKYHVDIVDMSDLSAIPDTKVLIHISNKVPQRLRLPSLPLSNQKGWWSISYPCTDTPFRTIKKCPLDHEWSNGHFLIWIDFTLYLVVNVRIKLEHPFGSMKEGDSFSMWSFAPWWFLLDCKKQTGELFGLLSHYIMFAFCSHYNYSFSMYIRCISFWSMCLVSCLVVGMQSCQCFADFTPHNRNGVLCSFSAIKKDHCHLGKDDVIFLFGIQTGMCPFYHITCPRIDFDASMNISLVHRVRCPGGSLVRSGDGFIHYKSNSLVALSR